MQTLLGEKIPRLPGHVRSSQSTEGKLHILEAIQTLLERHNNILKKIEGHQQSSACINSHSFDYQLNGPQVRTDKTQSIQRGCLDIQLSILSMLRAGELCF